MNSRKPFPGVTAGIYVIQHHERDCADLGYLGQIALIEF